MSLYRQISLASGWLQQLTLNSIQKLLGYVLLLSESMAYKSKKRKEKKTLLMLNLRLILMINCESLMH